MYSVRPYCSCQIQKYAVFGVGLYMYDVQLPLISPSQIFVLAAEAICMPHVLRYHRAIAEVPVLRGSLMARVSSIVPNLRQFPYTRTRTITYVPRIPPRPKIFPWVPPFAPATKAWPNRFYFYPPPARLPKIAPWPGLGHWIIHLGLLGIALSLCSKARSYI